MMVVLPTPFLPKREIRSLVFIKTSAFLSIVLVSNSLVNPSIRVTILPDLGAGGNENLSPPFSTSSTSTISSLSSFLIND